MLRCGIVKVKWIVAWVPTQDRDLKFNADGATRGKPGSVGIGGVLCNHRRDVLIMFSKNIGVKDSNEVEVMVISKNLRGS